MPTSAIQVTGTDDARAGQLIAPLTTNGCPGDDDVGGVGDMAAGGHTSTWELAPVGDERTRATQTYERNGVTGAWLRSGVALLAGSIGRAARAATA